jgi:hypothetical protein
VFPFDQIEAQIGASSDRAFRAGAANDEVKGGSDNATAEQREQHVLLVVRNGQAHLLSADEREDAAASGLITDAGDDAKLTPLGQYALRDTTAV